MKKLALISAVSLFASSAHASGFRDIKVPEIKNVRMELPAAQAPEISEPAKGGYATGEITELHLLAQAAKSLLFTYADTETLFNEFTGMWKPILVKSGLTPAATEYKDRFGTMSYASPDGRAVRDFIADGLNYNALDSDETAALRDSLLQSLESAGMTPVASFAVKNEIFRPTFNLYYLTAPDENPDREMRLRQLKNGDDMDFDVLKEAGINVVRRDASFSAVYIGGLVGFKAKLAPDEASAFKKLEDYRKFLAEQKKEFIGYRLHRLTEPFTAGDTTYNYQLNMYFYQ